MIIMAFFIHIISQSGDPNEHHMLIFLRRTDQSCVLIIINIHTFSRLLISWVFIGNIRYSACKIWLSRNDLFSKLGKVLT